jgi:hypothetical protein
MTPVFRFPIDKPETLSQLEAERQRLGYATFEQTLDALLMRSSALDAVAAAGQAAADVRLPGETAEPPAPLSVEAAQELLADTARKVTEAYLALDAADPRRVEFFRGFAGELPAPLGEGLAQALVAGEVAP